ncbi:hypothetical protein [Herpetosiphon geysericola]|uniref:Uncharacterized protein n=1 Tax=Herpetosiphon geysericola TaxID=70996 RepID=A0A0P6Y2A3_9CHLR|nr:hypothetical protein [Herpetosiphon geysericola]KPL90016.1 hypothetical protein SE18_08675 [Herpetosiphon geysericola]
MTNELAARSLEDERQADLIKAMATHIAELQAQVADLQTELLDQLEINWLFEELELAAGEHVVVINRVNECTQLVARGLLWQGPTLREVAVAAFEKEPVHGD